jgi:hypothetical protein
MYTRIRTICGGALMLFVLAACGGASPAGAPTAVPTAVPIDAGTTVPDGGTTGEATAYPAPAEVVPQQSAYPGAAPAAPVEAPSAYPGVTTTP